MEYYWSIGLVMLATATQCLAQPLQMDELAFGNITTPPSSPVVSLTYVTAVQLNLNWTASTGYGISYSVYRSTTNNFSPSTSTLVVSNLSSLSYNDTGVVGADSTNYFYTIKASNQFGVAYSLYVFNNVALIPFMTSNILPSGTASATTNTSFAFYGFTFGTATTPSYQWHDVNGTAPQRLIYDFGTINHTVESYRVFYNVEAGTTAWSLQGSNDGTNWTTMDTRSFSSEGNYTELFNISNTNTYSKYSLLCTSFSPYGDAFMTFTFQVYGY